MKTQLQKRLVVGLLTALFVGGASLTVMAQSPQMDVLTNYKSQLPQGEIFSAERGEILFNNTFTGGKPDNPSCTTCHTPFPLNSGKTKAGKIIDPMAFSISNTRYADLAKTEKWFRRNCKTVMGRECTPLEKGDFLTFMLGQ